MKYILSLLLYVSLSFTNLLSYSNLTKSTLNTLSNSAIQSGVYGTSFKDALLSNISNGTSNYLFKQAGNLGLVTNSKDGSLSKTLTHLVVGGSINAMQGDSFKDGALISGITEILRPLSNNLNKEEQLLSSQLIGILSGAIIDEDKGANKGFNLATSSEVYNRQLHKDEERFLEYHSEEFRKYYKDLTNKELSSQEARDLLFLSGRYIVDAKDNGIFNILNFFGKTDFSKDELNTGINFIYQKSQGLKFIDHYKENFTPTDFFSVTDEQFYNHNYNPNTPQGLSDESFMFIPSAKVGVSGVKGVGEIVYGTGKFNKVKFDIKNIETFKNANIKDVEKFLDKKLKGWTKAPLKKGDGIRYYDGKGRSFELNKGYQNFTDPTHGAPYLKTTIGSKKVRIPLK